MRALLSAVGTRGDVQPVIALALELRKRGHGVRLAIPPNFVEWAGKLGFEAQAVGIEMRAPRAGAAATMPTPEQLRKMAGDLITDQFEAVGAAATGCDLIVGAGAHQYAARSIAEKNGLPHVCILYAPVSLPSDDHAPPPGPGQTWGPGASVENARLWAENLKSWNDRSRERVNANRARLGLTAIDDVLTHILTDHPWMAADPNLGPAPSPRNKTVVQPGAFLLDDTSPLSPELESFVKEGEAPIYLGFGSMPAPQSMSAPLIGAARAVGRRAIVAAGWAELALMDDAADCISTGDVNQQLLFTRVAAVVHHGGAGTTTTAARAGVPQVVVPMFGDQHYWATRVQALGLGSVVPARALTTEALAAALREALKPETALRASSLAKHIVLDGAAIAAERLVAIRV